MRKSGVLMPVASLPGKYGIGTFSKNAYKFIDKLKSAGQSYWQMMVVMLFSKLVREPSKI